MVSTNIPLNLSGSPRGDRLEPPDPGAAIYWSHKGKSQCMAIDRYNRVADNLAAIAATLEALRAIERHGGRSILDRAFIGFAALPASTGKPWREVLEFGLSTPTPEMVGADYRKLAFDLHPDRQGRSPEAMAEMNGVRGAVLAELGF